MLVGGGERKHREELGRKRMSRHRLQPGHMWWQHLQRLQYCCQAVGETISRGPPLHHFQPRKALFELFSPGSIYDRHHSHRRILWLKTWVNHCLQGPVRSVLAQERYDSIFPVILCRKLHQTQARRTWTFCLDDHFPLALACHSGRLGSSQVTQVIWEPQSLPAEERYLGAALPDTLICKSTGWLLRDRRDQMKSWVWSFCFNFRQNMKPPIEWGKYQNKRQDSWPRNSATPTSKQFHSGYVGSTSWALVSTSIKLWVWTRWFSGLFFTYKIMWVCLSFIHLTS